jgi:tetratricopeptide (TPR) repeat protein
MTEPTERDEFARRDRQMKSLLGFIAALGAIGLYYLLQEFMPGPAGAPRFSDRGIGYYKEGKYHDAKDAFNRAIQLDSEYYPAYFGRALVHRRQNEINDALDDYATVIRLKPDYADAFYNRGLIYRDLGEPEKALGDFDAYVRLKPAEADGYARRVDVLHALGDFPRALADQDALVRLNDKSVPPYLARSALKRDSGDLDGALRDVEAAVALAPTDTEAIFQRGLLRRAMGDTAAAIADFDRAIELKAAAVPQGSTLPPNDMRFRLARGEALRDGGQTDAAKAEFDAAVQRVPTSATAHQQRGLLALFVLGDATAAAEDLEAAVREGVRHQEADKIMNYGIRAIEQRYHATTTQVDERPFVDQDVPYYPAIYWFVLWRQVVRAQAATAEAPAKINAEEFGYVDWGKVDIASVPARTPARRRVAWPLPIWLMLIGKTTPDLVHRAAENAPGAYERRLRLCEADFYTAEFDLAKGAGDEARRLLQSAVEGCPIGAPEATFAKAALQRLN